MKIRIRQNAAIVLSIGLISLSAGAVDALPTPSALPQFETERVIAAAEGSGSSVAQSASGSSVAQPPKVGDQIFFKIKGIHTPGLQISTNNQQESIENQGWSVVGIKSIENGQDSSVSAIALKAGKIIFPSLSLVNSEGKVLGETAPVQVEIVSAISASDPKPDQPADVQPPVGLQFPFWIVILAGVLGVTLLVLLGYALYRGIKDRLRNRKKPVKVLTEDEVALIEIAKLNELKLLEKGEFKRHYFRVSEILKNYVGGRYSFDALESTTGEMIDTLKGKNLPTMLASELVISNLSFLFQKLDLVKFTDHVPGTEESEQILGKAKEFIVNTRRAPLILNSSGVDNNAVT